MTGVKGSRAGVNEVGVAGLKRVSGEPIQRRPNKDDQQQKDTRVRDIDSPLKGQPTSEMFLTESPKLKISEVLPTPLSPLLPLSVGDFVKIELPPEQSVTNSIENFFVRRLPNVGQQHAYEVTAGTPPGTLVFAVQGLLNGITAEALVHHVLKCKVRESPAVTSFKMLTGESRLLMTCPDFATSIIVQGTAVLTRDVAALVLEGCAAEIFYFDALGRGLWKSANGKVFQCMTPRYNRKPLASHVWSEPVVAQSSYDFGVNGEQAFLKGLPYWEEMTP